MVSDGLGTRYDYMPSTCERSFEGFSKNGYHHAFQRIFVTWIALDEIDFGEIFEKS